MKFKDHLLSFVWTVEDYVPFVGVAVVVGIVTAIALYAAAHRPPPAQRALNPASVCVESEEGGLCYDNAPPYSSPPAFPKTGRKKH